MSQDTNASLLQQFFKVSEAWNAVERNKHCKLAVWVIDYADVELVDAFMQTEQSPMGSYDDLFFQMKSSYESNHQDFDQSLWAEFLSWFDEKPPEEKFDVLKAMKNDGIKSSVKKRIGLLNWFVEVLKDLPDGIRLATMEIKGKRIVKKPFKKYPKLVVELSPNLNVLEAINNEIDKQSGTYDPNDLASKLREQIKKVLEIGTKNKLSALEKELKKLFEIARAMDDTKVYGMCYLLAAHTYYTSSAKEKGMENAAQAITYSEELLGTEPDNAYPLLRSAIQLKAALHITNKEQEEALELYLYLAKKAVEYKDIYNIMEGYRLASGIYYTLGDYRETYEHALLALQAGSHLSLELRRNSTFLHAANQAWQMAEELREPKEKLTILEDHLKQWIGDDWKELLKNADYLNEGKMPEKEVGETLESVQ